MATGTAVDVIMPQMGVSVSEGTVTQWLKAVGESVNADEPLLEISTDKVDTEVPSPAYGVLTEILVQEGETVEVGTVIGRLGGDSCTNTPPDASPQVVPPAPAAEAALASEQTPVTTQTASPVGDRPSAEDQRQGLCATRP